MGAAEADEMFKIFLIAGGTIFLLVLGFIYLLISGIIQFFKKKD
jgi:hypothetical protein